MTSFAPRTHDGKHTAPIRTSLQSSLHGATRTVHMQLNKTIIARIPLALPPHAQDPSAYYLGMLAFAQIFYQFEYAVDSISSEPVSNANDQPTNNDRNRHVQIVQEQHTEGLSRKQSLLRDAELLARRLIHNPSISNGQEEAAQKVQRAATARTAHISQHIKTKPYLALAYTWTMYLALFNGGRWLHRQLVSAGPGFWHEQETSNENEALSFWHFDAATEQDPEAEQLKLEFKRNLDKASQLLTETEQEEVVQEAKSVFELCLSLIELLDDVMLEMSQTQASKAEQMQGVGQDTLFWRCWQRVSSIILGPTSSLFGGGWARPLESEVKASE